jgi:WD40 repeat protein
MPVDPAKTKLIIEHKHEVPLMSCVFSPKGGHLLAGGRDASIACIDVASGKKTALAGHDSWVGDMVRGADDLVLTSDYVGHVIAWDCSGDLPKLRWNIEAHPGTIRALAVSADGKTFATGDRDGAVKLWQSVDGKLLRELPRNEHPIYGLALHPDGKRIITADRQPKKPTIRVCDIASGNELIKIEVPELSGYRNVEDIEWGGIRSLTLTPDGAHIIACGRDGYDGPATLLLYQTESGKLHRKLASTMTGFSYTTRCHRDGFLMVASGEIAKGEFRAWHRDQDKSLADTATPGPCTCLDIHPDHQRFAITQAIGKSSYPETGVIAFYEWAG